MLGLHKTPWVDSNVESICPYCTGDWGVAYPGKIYYVCANHVMLAPPSVGFQEEVWSGGWRD